MLKYNKLLTLMEQKEIKKSSLRNFGFSPHLVNKLERGEHMNTINVDKLCRLLECQPGDIMEWVPDPVEGEAQ